MIPIQTTIVGYAGTPCTLFSAYDDKSLILTLAKEAPHRTKRQEGCLIITNDPEIERDTLFVEEFFHDAINAYYWLLQGVASDGSSSKLIFSENANRSRPTIEKDGIDSNGQKYRISEDITCVQVAALATCWQVSKMTSSAKAIDMADRILEMEHEFMHGYPTIFTI